MQFELTFIRGFPLFELDAVQELAPLRGYERYPLDIFYQFQAFLHFGNDGRELCCVPYEY
jgi:hypothetical protein